MEPTLDELIARTAITDVMLLYTRAGDAGSVDDFTSCFSPDGVLETHGRSSRGHAEITAFVHDIGALFRQQEGFLPARHHLASMWVERTGADESRGGAYFSLVAASGLDHWGTYSDRFVRRDGRWRFARRTVRIEGARHGSPVAHLCES